MIGIPKQMKEAINQLDIHRGMQVMQFGSQKRGHIAHVLAEKVGEKGEVLLVDVLTEELRTVEKEFADRGTHWVHGLMGDFARVNGVPAENQSMDRIIIAHTAWRHPSHEAVIQEATRIIKPEGKILFLDWQKENTHPVGRQVHGHLDMLEAQRLCVQSGCEKVERIINTENHWGFIMNF